LQPVLSVFQFPTLVMQCIYVIYITGICVNSYSAHVTIICFMLELTCQEVDILVAFVRLKCKGNTVQLKESRERDRDRVLQR